MTSRGSSNRAMPRRTGFSSGGRDWPPAWLARSRACSARHGALGSTQTSAFSQIARAGASRSSPSFELASRLDCGLSPADSSMAAIQRNSSSLTSFTSRARRSASSRSIVCASLVQFGILQDEERGEHFLELDRRLGQLASFVQQELEAKMIGGLKQLVGLLVHEPGAFGQLDFSRASALRSSGVSADLKSSNFDRSWPPIWLKSLSLAR